MEKIVCAPRIEEGVDTVGPSEDRDSCSDSSNDSLDLDEVGDMRQDLLVESSGLALEESVELAEGNSGAFQTITKNSSNMSWLIRIGGILLCSIISRQVSVVFGMIQH